VDPGCVQINVVLPDGRQYRIDRPHTPGQRQSVTLSPKGRYVVWTAPTGPVLRDLLTGDDLPVVAPEQFQGWSPDSFWLLGTERNGQLLVLANPLFGESHAFGPSEEAPLDVLNDGRLLLFAGYRLDGLIPMMVSDPLHSAVPAAFTVDAAPYLSPGQTVAVHTPQVSRIPHWVGAGAYGHAVMAINCADTGPNCGLLVFSPVDGKVQRRIDLPGRGLARSWVGRPTGRKATASCSRRPGWAGPRCWRSIRRPVSWSRSAVWSPARTANGASSRSGAAWRPGGNAPRTRW